jgi:hypothetical protein
MIDNDLAAWDLPLTDDFVDRVGRGVRRRRLWRDATIGGAGLAVMAAVVVAAVVARPAGPTRPVTPPAVSTPASGPALDGFTLTRLPAGAVRVGPDSFSTVAVTETGLGLDDPSLPADQARAAMTTRQFERGTGIGLFATVLRPEPPEQAAQVVAWLVHRFTAGREPIRTFDVPVGQARLLADVGSETTSYEVVLTTPDHLVVKIEGHSSFTAAELEEMARGLTR